MEFSTVQWLGLCTFTAVVGGSVLCQETKILQAVWHSQEDKKVKISVSTKILIRTQLLFSQ